MPRTKQASKRRRGTKAAPVLGAAGLTLSLAGGASAAAVPVADTATAGNAFPNQITLGEEEVSDVSLATFYVFDKENSGLRDLGVQLARGGCGGCRGGGGGCGGGRGCGGRGCPGGCRGCGGRGCLGGCGCGGGCGGACCISWGGCALC